MYKIKKIGNPMDLSEELRKLLITQSDFHMLSEASPTIRVMHGEPIHPTKVIYNGNKTIVIWDDNTKTIVSCGSNETFDKYTGFIAAYAKRMFGSTPKIKKMLKKIEDDQRNVKGEKIKPKLGTVYRIPTREAWDDFMKKHDFSGLTVRFSGGWELFKEKTRLTFWPGTRRITMCDHERGLYELAFNIITWEISEGDSL